MEPRDRALLLFALGIVLVLNPVYLFPGGLPHQERVTYRAERVERLDPYGGPVAGVEILDCAGPIHHRECVLARQVGYNGSMRLPEGTEFHLEDDEYGLYTHFEYVRFPEGYARPNATGRNGSLVLTFEPRTSQAVLSEYAYPYGELPAVGKRAIREGSATVTRRFVEFDEREPLVADYQEFVERNGTFYAIRRGTGAARPVIPEWLFALLRIVGVTGGAVLAFVGASRHGRLVDGEEPTFGPRFRER